MQLSAAVFALSVASAAYAANFTVKVGADGFTFTPSNLTNVQVGDGVSFEFHAKNHSVTQSTFASPCTFLEGGVSSGFMAVNTTNPPFPTWDITIMNVSAPLWFYCAQTTPQDHCNSGMVFAINPTAEKSFADFQAVASTVTPGSAPPLTAVSGDSSTQSSSAGTPGAIPPVTNTGISGASSTTDLSAPPTPSAADPNASPISSAADPNASSSTQVSQTTTSGAPTTTDNGAAGMGVSASGILALAGLVAGLML